MSALISAVLAGAGGAIALAGGALGYASKQIMAPAKGNPAEFLAGGGARDRCVTVCLGASIVHGRVSVDFVDLLRKRFPADGYAFVNAGINGDLAYNARERLDSVIACRPDAVVILVGTNDIQGTLSERVKALSMRGKKLPCEPSIAWYAENMTAILERLRAETEARVAICSLPVLGEDLASLANRRVEEFNQAIRHLAELHGASYLPIHELQIAWLKEHGRTAGPEYTDNPMPVMLAGYGHYLLGRSFDDISRRNGLALTTDRIHLNSISAGMVADEVECFLLAG